MRLAREPAPPLGPTLDLLRGLWAVEHGLAVLSRRMDAGLGVTGPQRLVLRIAGRFPGISAGSLAELLHLHPSTITEILHRLEGRGLLGRRSDPTDGRRTLIGLTPAGQELNAATPTTAEDIVEQLVASFPPGEVESARRVLDALAGLLAAPDAGAASLGPPAKKAALRPSR